MNNAPPVEGDSDHYFTKDAARVCAEEIAAAGQVEVFFIGRRDPESALIVEVEAHAYGSSNAVPALSQLAKPGDVLIHNHPSGNLLPSDPDLNIASSAGMQGIGFFIIDNKCRRCRVIVKAIPPKKKVPLDEADVMRRLSPQGTVGSLVSDFEDRPQQREMAAAITRAFNSDGIAVIEAGTGTGKSFAYLIPSILYALRNGERVVVSTNTINLQEQLLHKDIPALRKALGEEIEVEIVKGRGNYVCKRKAEYAREEAHTLLEDDFTRELRELLDWASTSVSGDRQELPVSPRYEAWERVQSEADNCLRVRCKFYEQCFFYNSRRRAARAKVLIVNHSLLLSDLAVRRASNNYSMAAVLPPYTRVVLDEAHHLEEVATKALAAQVTRNGLRQLFARLYRRDSGKGARGIINSLLEALENAVRKNVLFATEPAFMRLASEVAPRIVDVRESVDFLLTDFTHQFLNTAGINSIPQREELKIRITPALRKHPGWEGECVRLLQMMADELAAFVAEHQALLEQFDDLDEETLEGATDPLMEWKAYVGRVEEARRTLTAFLTPSPEYCQWVEIAQRTSNRNDLILRLCHAPIHVDKLLREALHDKMKTEVLTSATLTVDANFRFLQDRVGLPSPRDFARPKVDEYGEPIRELEPRDARSVEELMLPTPFNYREQVFFGLPSDLPDPRESAFDHELAELINRSVAISGGRAFILFTSYGQLKKVADLCEPTIRRLGIEVLRHGNGNRDHLLARFRQDETSVLFATTSFWEGVDVRGRALELLIIAKLPFSVPTEPIQEAQFESIKASGRDPFNELVIPRAVIRFKQGFGRLIRARTDRGAVIVADKRITEARYGQRFLRSLPDIEVRKGRRDALMRDMETFFRSRPPVATPDDEDDGLPF